MQPHDFYGGRQLPPEWWNAAASLGLVGGYALVNLLIYAFLLFLFWLFWSTMWKLRKWLIRQERAYEDAREDAELQRRQRAIERETQARRDAASRSTSPQPRAPLVPGERKEPHL